MDGRGEGSLAEGAAPAEHSGRKSSQLAQLGGTAAGRTKGRWDSVFTP